MSDAALLDEATLAALLAPLDLRLHRTAVLDGPAAGRLRLDTDGGRVFVRIDDGRREADLRAEASLRWHLGARRFPTPQPLRRPDGTPFVVAGDHRVSIYPWVAGKHLAAREARAEHAAAVGEVLGRLHLLGADFDARPDVSPGPGAVAALLERHRAESPDAVAELLDETDRIAAARAPALPSGLVHQALGPDAVLWRGDRVVAVLDLARAGVGPLATDVALTTLEWCSFGADLDEDRVKALLRGYGAVRMLSDVERTAFPVELRLANVILAVRDRTGREGLAVARERVRTLAGIDAARVAGWLDAATETA